MSFYLLEPHISFFLLEPLLEFYLTEPSLFSGTGSQIDYWRNGSATTATTISELSTFYI